MRRFWRRCRQSAARSVSSCGASTHKRRSVMDIVWVGVPMDKRWQARPDRYFPHFSLAVARQAQAGELPARRRGEKIAIAVADVVARRGAGSAAQHILIHHEFSVVFADRAFGLAESGIRRVARLRPLPYVAEHLPQPCAAGGGRMKAAMVGEMAFDQAAIRRVFPFGFSRKSRP